MPRMKNSPDIARPDPAPETEAPPTGRESAPPENQPPKKRRPLAVSLLRILFLLLVVLALVPVAAEVALRQVPFETWKPTAESKLSLALKMPVHLSGADLSLLRGARIKGVTVGGKTPLVQVREVVLDYDLFQLIEGRLVINQVLVDRPVFHLIEKQGRWNFEPLLNGRKTAEAETAAPPEAGLPPVPLAVSLKDLSIKNLKLTFEREGRDRGSVDGLSLAARGTLDRDAIDLALAITMSRPPEAAAHNVQYDTSEGQHIKTLALADLGVTTGDLDSLGLKGRFSLTSNQVKLADELPAPNISSDFDTHLTLRQQAFDIDRLVLEIDGAHRITLKAAIRDYKTHPRIDLTLADAAFDIEKALALARPWLPPLAASGRVSLKNVHAAGDFPDFKPGDLRVDSGRIEVEGMTARYEPLDIQGMNAQANLEHLKLKGGQPSDLKATMNVKLDSGRFTRPPDKGGMAKVRGLKAAVRVNRLRMNASLPEALDATVSVNVAGVEAADLTLSEISQSLNLVAENPRLTEVKLAFKSDVKSITTSRPEFAGVTLPFNMEGSLAGNWDRGNLPSFTVDYSAGEAIRGHVEGSAKKLGREAFLIKKSAVVDLAGLVALAPRALLKNLEGLELAGKADFASEVTGVLNEQFLPEKLTSRTFLEVARLDAALASPALDIKNLSARLTLSADYDRTKGARLGSLRLKADFDGARALGNWKLKASHAEAEVAAPAAYIALPPAGDIPLSQHVVFQSAQVASTTPGLVLDGLGLDARMTATLSGGKALKKIKLDGKLSLDETRALEKISTGAIESAFVLFAGGSALALSSVKVTLDMKAPSLRQGEWTIAPGPLHFAGETTQNLETGDVTIKTARLGLPLFDLDASGQATNWGETVDLKAALTKLDLAGIKPHLPPNLAAELAGLNLGGQARLDLAARGRLPKEGFDRAHPSLPLDLSALVQLQDGLVEWPEKDIQIKSAALRTSLGLGGEAATLSGGGKFLVTAARLKDTWLDPDFDFRLSLEGADKLRVEAERLGVSKLGLTHNITGQIDGLRPFITGEVEGTVRELLNRLDIALKTENRLKVAEALKGPAVELSPGIEAHGAIDSHLDLRLKAADFIELGGQVSFDRFKAALPGGLKVAEVNGSVPFEKKLWIEKRPPEQGPPFLAARKGFFKQLRSFSSRKNILRAGAIEWQGHRASGLQMDLVLKNNQLMAERFIFDILGGALAGNFFLTQTPEGPMLNFFSEFAGLDFDRLLPAGGASARTGQARDASVDGSLKLGFQLLKKAGGAISLDQIRSEIAITSIGAETLDRLLLFIDPEESKPAIVDTRAKLELASPHQILISLENGNLNVAAWLKNKVLGDIIKAPELRRVPVAGLKQFQAITDRIEALTGLRDALHYLAARSIRFDEEQNIVLD